MHLCQDRILSWFAVAFKEHSNYSLINMYLVFSVSDEKGPSRNQTVYRYNMILLILAPNNRRV